jgi:hypothetical protein
MTGTDLNKRLDDIRAGQFGLPESRLPGADQNPDIQFGRSIAGHDDRPSGLTTAGSGGGVRRTIWEGLGALAGLAGAVAGFFIGANALDEGVLVGLLAMAGGTILGFLAGTVPFILLENGWQAIGEKMMFARRGSDATAQNLAQYWADMFGVTPERELIEAVDENGAAWVMDKHGNFIMRMRGGKTLFVGYRGGGEHAIVEKQRGRGFDAEDARLLMLAHRSLGRSSISLNGNKKVMRLLWIAAKQADMELSGYKPDKRALQMLHESR